MSATPQLSIEKFGSELLRTLDLDPVYIMLTNAKMTKSQLSKWLLAYWCFYHCGVASLISEAKSDERFWSLMLEAAQNDRQVKNWPRSSERRHFRGKTALAGVHGLLDRFSQPELVLTKLEEHAYSFANMNQYVQSWPQFGPWIAFKVCDMAQSVLDHSLGYRDAAATLAVYEEPAKGAEKAYYIWKPEEVGTVHKREYYVSYAVARLKEALGHHDAPPRFNRKLNFFEYETILCKWKSHTNGHYPIGKDTHEIAEGLRGWGDTAHELRNILLSRTLVDDADRLWQKALGHQGVQ